MAFVVTHSVELNSSVFANKRQVSSINTKPPVAWNVTTEMFTRVHRGFPSSLGGGVGRGIVGDNQVDRSLGGKTRCLVILDGYVQRSLFCPRTHDTIRRRSHGILCLRKPRGRVHWGSNPVPFSWESNTLTTVS